MRSAAALAAILLAASPAAARCVGGQTVSWYGEAQRLSDGSRYDPSTETCAHRTLPFGTVLRVEDLETGLGADCVVDDRGPNVRTGCQVDVSRRVAELIGIKERGVAKASIRVLKGPEDPPAFYAGASPAGFEERWALTGLPWSKTAPAVIYARFGY